MGSSVLFSIVIFLISTSVLCLALLVRVSIESVPFALNFSVSQPPALWSSFLSWLRPPYLYLIINFIIITIVASSRFQYSNDGYFTYPEVIEVSSASKSSAEIEASEEEEEEIRFDSGDQVTVAEVVYESPSLEVEEKACVYEDTSRSPDIVKDDEVAVCRLHSSKSLPELITLAEKQKPLVPVPFGHRKPIEASLEGGRKLRVSRSQRHQSLENTWKMITEGRSAPLTRDLKKLETWKNHGRQLNVDLRQVKKSETFKDRTNYQMPRGEISGRKVRREPSLSQDELNRRVEEFIRNFNEQMRLQRQESLNQHYKEMISRENY